MNVFILVGKVNRQIFRVFNWGDNRELPENYPIPEDCVVLKISENFAEHIRTNWLTRNTYIRDINTTLDSSKNFSDYFTETERAD